MSTETDDFIPTRRSLLARLKDWGDQESWQVFFDTYWRLIYGIARKAGLSEDEAQDVVQETVLSVAKTMKTFRYDPAVCSFKGWLYLLTRRRIADRLRRREREPSAGEPLPEEDAGSDAVENLAELTVFPSESAWDAEWERNLLDAALERVKGKVSALHFQMFDYYAVKGWAVAEVARTLEVSRPQVYLAKHRVAALLKKELKRLEAEGA
ncbi:MAG: sigma-70 family RNA polymerase sigma factor [Verrucomicrobia bacterium]|nr:sigma-70 family RNA polymerase sigma factor [Verrucomicrobiota bacterium]